jgi:cytochrome c peroxidase
VRKVLVLVALLVLACGEAPGTERSSGEAGSGGAPSGHGGAAAVSGGAATVTPRGDGTSKEELAPVVLPPPPPDVSNRFADDRAAAALGQKLFHDPEFAGALLDLDADGGPDSLGVRGDTGKVSCAGCHEAEHGFLDTRSVFKQISLGTGWTHRRTPTLLDVGQAKMIMWGGRRTTLQSQVFGPIESPLEMNSSRLFVAERIAQKYAGEYEAIFGAGMLAPLADEKRFPRLTPETTGCRLAESVDHPRLEPPDALYECHGIPGDRAEYDSMARADQDLVTRIVIDMGKAIAAFERRLDCGPGRFDAWTHGDASALTAAEQVGFAVFVGKGKCVSCHSGPYFSDQAFHNVGLAEGPTRAGILNANDRGAAADLAAAASDPLEITGKYSDGDDRRLPSNIGRPESEGAFRTPTLRCAGSRPSFMHSGLLRTLAEVVEFFDRGGDPGGYVGKSVLSPLGLTDVEKAALVAFLNALEGPGPAPELLEVP